MGVCRKWHGFEKHSVTREDGRKTWQFFPLGHWVLLPVGLCHCLDLRKSRDVQTALFVGWFKHFIGLFQSPSASQSSPNRPRLLTLLLMPRLLPVVPSLLHMHAPSSREAAGVAALPLRLHGSPGRSQCPLIGSPFLFVTVSPGTVALSSLGPRPVKSEPGGWDGQLQSLQTPWRVCCAGSREPRGPLPGPGPAA